jgi:hypothetical protein
MPSVCKDDARLPEPALALAQRCDMLTCAICLALHPGAVCAQSLTRAHGVAVVRRCTFEQSATLLHRNLQSAMRVAALLHATFQKLKRTSDCNPGKPLDSTPVPT